MRKNSAKKDTRSTREMLVTSMKSTWRSWMADTYIHENDSTVQKALKMAMRLFYLIVLTLCSPLLLLAFIFTLLIAL